MTSYQVPKVITHVGLGLRLGLCESHNFVKPMSHNHKVDVVSGRVTVEHHVIESGQGRNHVTQFRIRVRV